MNMKRLSSVLLAAILVFALAAPAFAADGSITIDNSSDGTSPDGRTFYAYKILDVTLAADNTPAYSVPTSATLRAFYGTRFHGSATYYDGMTQAAVNADVIAQIAALTSNSAMQSFAEAALTAAKTAYTNSEITRETIVGSSTKTLPYGYYVIEDSSTAGTGSGQVAQVSAVMVDTTTPDVTINLKANTPSIDKTIVDGANETDYTNGSIGDAVNYKITSTVPDMTDFDSYVFKVSDTLSTGLTLNYVAANNPDGIVVKLDRNGDGDLLDAGDVLTKGTDYTVDQSGQTFTITFTSFIQYKSYGTPAANLKGKAIEITYSATINENAVIGVAGNPNAARLIYSNDPKNDTLTGTTLDKKTYTYVTGLNLKKVDGTTKNALVGAVFTLKGISGTKVVVLRDVFTEDSAASPAYYKLADGTYTTTAATGTDPLYAGTYPYPKYAKTTVTDVQTTDAEYKVTGTVGGDGKLTFNGLGEGTYTLTEITAPDGYNILVSPITVAITWTAPADPTASTNCVWSCLIGGSETVSNGVVSISVDNVKGTELPSTGGIGTTIFTIGGIALILAAGLLLILRRKPKKAVK
jgi:fimbrial isopeptide formation D2 family protein/LPXTG-motif cell wall-anchored protein